MNAAVTADEALKLLQNNHRVFIHSAAAAPQKLIDAMVARANDFTKIKIYHLHTDSKAHYADEKYKDIFEVNSLFIGSNVRSATQMGTANYIPCFLSEVPVMLREKIIPIDVVLVQVSAPDNHGFCSLGISVDATKAAVDVAKIVIAQVNPQMPRTHGDGLIHISKFDAYVEVDEPIYEHPFTQPNEVEARIGKHIAGLIDDGSCLQMGIGSIPNAVLANLGNHKDLGIHTEMFSDGILPLVEKGVITNSRKKIHPGKIISGFAFGSRKLYDFMDDNPLVNMLDIGYVNDVKNIRRNDNVIAINSAIEVDLTGQVCADSIGTRFYSGVGGQMDFIRGASLSKGGKPIIALPSVTKRGESKITPILKQGAGVVTTRAHVQYVVTEYGVANLYGKSIKERINSLIEIAHPDHREGILKQAHEFYHL